MPGRREPDFARPSPRRELGFTLIEIMAVVIVMGLLVAMVGVNVAGQMGKAKVDAARIQMKRLDGALEFYHMDNSRYPTTDQGLDALARRPSIPPEPRRYQEDGYIKGNIPVDPWGEPYQYRSPGERNPRSYDIWSWGADGAPGGEGNDADIGNWGDETGRS